MQALDLSPVDPGGVSALWHKRSKPLGKVKRRVQDLRTTTPSYIKLSADESRQDLSHNEAARLAMDSLLNQGMEGYKEVLSAEGEVDFLSKLEKTYIMENGMNSSTAEPDASADKEPESSSGSRTSSQCPTLSTHSELTVADMNTSRGKGVTKTAPVLGGFRIYFQCDSRACGMKDVVRELIRNAVSVLAVVIDSFSDMELLFDLLEASRKRNVSVYLLLDHLNVDIFVSMWQNLKLDSKNFPKISVRSVGGETYCAKTGHKLTGQMAESFVIADWREVLTGSFSFSWLSWHVYRSLVVLLKGSMAECFHHEFKRLYSSSIPVPGFVDCMPLTCELPFNTEVQSAQDSKAAVQGSSLYQTQTMSQEDMITDAFEMELKQQQADLARIRSLELERRKSDTQPPQKTETGAQVPEKPVQTEAKPQIQELQSTPVEKPENTAGAVCTPCDAETEVEPEKKQEQNKKQNANAQPHLNSSTVTTEADSNVKTEDSNPQQTAESQSQATSNQSSHKLTLNLNPQNVDTEGVSFQQQNRESLVSPSSGVPSGLNAQRRHWMTQDFKSNMDFVPDHSRPLSPGTGTTWYSQPHTPQQVMPPARLNWMPQSHRPAAARQNSFDSFYRMGQNTITQVGWRPFYSMYSGLQRSRSMNEKGY